MSARRAPGLPPNPWNPHAWVIGDPEIGEGTWIGAFTLIDGSGGLRIGRGLRHLLGRAHLHPLHRPGAASAAGPTRRSTGRRSTIGDHVFIGANAVVNMGVASATRPSSAPAPSSPGTCRPCTVVAGVPARPAARVVLDGDLVRFVPLDSD